ncbi:hypothetical protein Patl1_01164 [Pistacia atlantica]|uniref:Uncharacterized protein n=1 Tax=Pistacia atlantica TaxID=434234 RepID=A0ACC1CB89_9ROSI|nr:hypothetical protein Patl1_01164 [Pistacia atlantica]
MEKKNNSTCEKIFKAINISPSFRTIRRISHSPQHPMPSPNPSKPVKPLNTPKNRDGAEVVSIKYDNSSLPAHPNEKLKSKTPPAPKKEATSLMIPVQKKPNTLVPLSSQHGEGRKTGAKDDRVKSNKWGENAEDKFSNFIYHAKKKITATNSHVGEQKNDDHFSNYIDRVKHKIRKMSSFVGGSSGSAK